MKKLLIKRATMKNNKSWGHEIHWAMNDKYFGKILHIGRMKTISKRYHSAMDKTIYVLNGVLIVETETELDRQKTTLVLREGESMRIQPKTIHRLSAPIEGYVNLIEVSTPQSDDVIELLDDHDGS
jgi:mannose-6-phosphate isomerase-like protein (cupin superfamily)